MFKQKVKKIQELSSFDTYSAIANRDNSKRY
jgi:hypothetical protein